MMRWYSHKFMGSTECIRAFSRGEESTMMEKEWLLNNPHLTAEKMSPIEERIPAARAEVHEGLSRAKGILGEEGYKKYLAPLQNLAKSGTTLLVTVRTARERTMLVKECLPALKKAFGASVVKVVAV